MLIVGRQMGDMDITIDPIVLNGQATTEPGALVTGSPPPHWRSVWPWVLVGTGLLAVWYFATAKKGGASRGLPFVG
jgi:hypothetical protein